jgi:hypothetical protein
MNSDPETVGLTPRDHRAIVEVECAVGKESLRDADVGY